MAGYKTIPCRFVGTVQGCRKGDKCTFIHSSVIAEANARAQEPNEVAQTRSQYTPAENSKEAKFRAFRFKIPLKGQCKVLSPSQLISLWQDAEVLVESDIGIVQQTVGLLASEGGVLRTQELCDLCLVANPLQSQTAMTSGLMSLLKIMVHPNVEHSPLLETHIATICNCLYGPLGQRSIKLFTKLLNDFADYSDEDSAGLLRLLLTVLSKIVDISSHALVNPDLLPIVERFEQLEREHPSTIAKRKLERIQRRLNLIQSSPEAVAADSGNTIGFMTFQQDGPGSLSEYGPRHDNDHADFTQIKIMPTMSEIEATRADYLPVLDASQWHEPGAQGLLDRNFRLLREDTVGPVRDVVRAQLEHLRGQTQRTEVSGLFKSFCYAQLSLRGAESYRHFGLCFRIGFPLPAHLMNMSANRRGDWHTQTRRLQMGALVCVVAPCAGVFFCEVVNADLSGQLGKDINKAAYTPVTKHEQSLWMLMVKLVDNAPTEATRLAALVASSRARPTSRMVEFPGVLLASFLPTLRALQDIACRSELPFESVLLQSLGNEQPLGPPQYATKPSFKYDLKWALRKEARKDAQAQHFLNPLSAFDRDAFKQDTLLDEAQADGLIDILKRDFALLQGPPGTGKSFVGGILIKILIDVRKAARLGPILCVCYTNHALDQLLEHLMDDGVRQIVRMGGQSKSDKLKELNLFDLAFKESQTKTEGSTRFDLRKDSAARAAEVERCVRELMRNDASETLKHWLEMTYPDHYHQLWAAADADGFQIVQKSNKKKSMLQAWLYGRAPERLNVRSLAELSLAPLGSMSTDERQSLYQHWRAESHAEALDKLTMALHDLQETTNKQNKVNQEAQLRVLKRAHVVGCTTTGLAKNLELLRHLPLKVVVCEEAGEVLEAHLLTALLPSVEHAILIGDHEQLRPQINNFALQLDNPQGEQYSLNLSLFERLVKPRSGSAVPFSTLQIQRRMDPSISVLIRQNVYPDLQDSETVKAYPPVVGMKKRLFWLKHNVPEDSQEDAHSHSKTNGHEVELAAMLVSHLIKQGTYADGEIALLTPYLGQLLGLRRKLSKVFEIALSEGDKKEIEALGLEDVDGFVVTKKSALKTIRIATVDNFQGEEAKVVVISLVRSNPERKCGFFAHDEPD